MPERVSESSVQDQSGAASPSTWGRSMRRILIMTRTRLKNARSSTACYGSFTDSDDLIKQCLTLDLPTIPRTKPNNLPYGSLGSLFKGRDETLEKLHSQLTPSARILRLSADLVS